MKATIAYIEQKFEEFNDRMFGGQLPKLPFVLSDEGSALGKCCFNEFRNPDGSKEYSNFSLRINTRIDLPEDVLEDVIIHEMIHYFILRHNINDTSAHGEVFKAIMNSINTTYGRKISIRHDASAEEREQAVSGKRIWHVIAVVHLKSGELGVKVLPRITEKIIHYHTQVSAMRNVESVDLYLHDNPFFNRYSTSAAIRIEKIEAGLLETNLQEAKRLRIKGTQVVQD